MLENFDFNDLEPISLIEILQIKNSHDSLYKLELEKILLNKLTILLTAFTIFDFQSI